MRVLLAPSADLARQVLATENVAVTVEAEYGSYVAEGPLYTAAHHQPAGSPFAGNHVVEGGRRSPCCDTDIPVIENGEVVLVSHVDLDTFGGVLRTMPEFADLFPVKPKDVPALAADTRKMAKWMLDTLQTVAFWNLAEFVDVRGPHKLGNALPTPRTLSQLYAFWAWSRSPEGGPRLPRDQVTDVTDLVRAAGGALRRIFADDEAMLAAGDTYKAEEDALNRRTFSRREGDVIVRIATKSREFCNHLYVDPDGVPAKAVASLSAESGSVTISLADPVPGVSCRNIVQTLWGPEAGGHDGIAGSPRERHMSDTEFLRVIETLAEALRNAGG